MSKAITQLLNRHREEWAQPHYDKLNNQILNYFSETHPQQRINNLANVFEEQYRQFNYQRSRQFLCSKIFRLNQPNQFVFYCQNCKLQFTSVICEGCFDTSLHQGHRWRKQQIKNGSCDCGDKTKWKEQGFCKKHRYFPERNQLSQQLQSRYFKITHYLFKVVFSFYQIYLQKYKSLQKNNPEIINLRNLFDGFGELFMNTLIESNKNRQCITKLTNKLVHEIASIGKKQVKIIDILLSFSFLPKTTEKCIQLFIILFYNNQGLREYITIEYFKRYETFLMSNYNQFSLHLLSNSETISKLSLESKLAKLVLLNTHQQSFNKKLEIYRRYTIDLAYLASLKPQCSKDYWNLFNNLGGFVQIGNYCQAFKLNLHQNSQKHYQLQHNFLTTIIRILQKMIKFKDNSFFQELIFQLFQKITQKNYQIEKNYFFTYERFWTLCVYVLFVDKYGSFNGIDENAMKFLNGILKLNGLNGQQKCTILVQKVLQYLFKTDLQNYGQSEEQKRRYNKFSNLYLGNLLLGSIDAIMFRIVLKLTCFLDKNNWYNVNLKNIVSDRINAKIKHYGQNQIDKAIRCRNLTQIVRFILKATNVANQLHQCIYSDLPDLILGSYFDNVRNMPYYRKAYFKYYQNLFFSLNEQHKIIPIKQFVELCRFLLFKEDFVLRQFIAKNKSKIPECLENSKKNGRKINIRNYSYLSRAITLNNSIRNLIDVNDIVCIPYEDNVKAQYRLSQSLCSSVLESIITKTQTKQFDQMSISTFFNVKRSRVNPKIENCLLLNYYRCQILKCLWKIAKFDNMEAKSSQLLNNMKRIKPFHNKESHEKISIQFDQQWRINKKRQEILQISLNKMSVKSEDQGSSKQKYQDSSQQIKPKEQKNHEESQYNQYQNLQKQQIQAIQENNRLPQSSQQQKLSSSEIPSQQNQLNQPINNLTNSTLKQENLPKPLDYSCKKYSHSNRQCCNSKCINGQSNIKKLYLICCVTVKTVSHLFQLNQNYETLMIASCNHLYHLECAPQISEKEFGVCAKCQSKFNCLIVPCQSKAPQKEQIQTFFIQLIKILKEPLIKMQNQFLNIFKWLIISSLMISTSHQKLDNKKLQIYQFLWNVLKHCFFVNKDIQRIKAQISKQIFPDKQQSKFKEVKLFLIDLFGAQIFGDTYFNYKKYKNIYLQINQANKLQSFLRVLLKDNQFVIAFNKKENIPAGKIMMKELPRNIQIMANSFMANCSCLKKQKLAFMVCLQIQQQTNGCMECFPTYIKNLLKKHNQILVIKTDSGFITYYTLVKDKIWSLEVGSVYLNALMQPITTSLKLNQAAFENKSQYILNNRVYQQIIYKFSSRQYFIRKLSKFPK